MIASVISLITALAPTVTNLILHFVHPDGTTTIVVLLGQADAANTLNATNIAAFQAVLGTAIATPAKTTV
jgi:hypothetical protein